MKLLAKQPRGWVGMIVLLCLSLLALSACNDYSTPRYDPFGPDRDCGDFRNWKEAQAFYEAAGGPHRDRHDLDRDRDGIACEALSGAP